MCEQVGRLILHILQDFQHTPELKINFNRCMLWFNIIINLGTIWNLFDMFILTLHVRIYNIVIIPNKRNPVFSSLSWPSPLSCDVVIIVVILMTIVILVLITSKLLKSDHHHDANHYTESLVSI